MILELSQHLTPSIDETLNRRWRYFTQTMNRPELLSTCELVQLKSIFDVFKHLMNKGQIDYGRYDTVKRILEVLELNQCANIITKFEEMIRDVKQGKTSFTLHSYNTIFTLSLNNIKH